MPVEYRYEVDGATFARVFSIANGNNGSGQIVGDFTLDRAPG
jgi:hypothetical protein